MNLKDVLNTLEFLSERMQGLKTQYIVLLGLPRQSIKTAVTNPLSGLTNRNSLPHSSGG